MKRIEIYQVDAFTRTRFEGNPAGVVLNADGLTDTQMQAIARELNNPETAFICSPFDDSHDMCVRFFTPTTEVPTCGHATISAHYVNAKVNRLPSCVVHQHIGIGVLPVEIIRQDEDYSIIMTQGDVSVSPPVTTDIRNSIIDAMGLRPTDLDTRLPMKIASTGHSKVMIGVYKKECLNNLQPNMNRLMYISQKIDCNGYFVFTLDSGEEDILTHGRMFAPAIGIHEDPVTGNANGPLGAYLACQGIIDTLDGKFTFNAKQGEAIGRPGIVTVTVGVDNGTPTKVTIQGDAVIAFSTAITI